MTQGQNAHSSTSYCFYETYFFKYDTAFLVLPENFYDGQVLVRKEC